MKSLNCRGFSLLEAIVSIFIVTFMLTATVTLVLNIRLQTQITNNKVMATQVASALRDNLIRDSSYSEISDWLDGASKSIDNESCLVASPPFSCDIFAYDLGGIDYSASITIEFKEPSTTSLAYQIIHFEIIIEYHPGRFVRIEGIIYE